jgi:YesN/AraC family two-component response regulator
VEAIEQPIPISGSKDRSSLLLIEDNPEVVAYIRTCLEKDYEIAVAENGEIGIHKAVEQIPDIIISDVMMPVKDGFAVTEFLKNDERTSHIPIVLLTAKADAESRLIGLTRGADAYLAKPFDKKELLVRLAQLIALRKKLLARYAQFSPPQPTEDAGLRIEDAFLQKVNSIIEAHLDEAEFGVNELCRAVGLSRPQLFRKLKALTDKSIVAYLRSARLHKARELLLTGERNISEVAFEVGFNDPLYFSRAFSQEFGFPPTALLK